MNYFFSLILIFSIYKVRAIQQPDEVSKFLLENGDDKTSSHLEKFRNFINAQKSPKTKAPVSAVNDYYEEPLRYDYFGFGEAEHYMESSGKQPSEKQIADEKQIEAKLLQEDVSADDFVWIEHPSFDFSRSGNSDSENNLCKGVTFLTLFPPWFVLISSHFSFNLARRYVWPCNYFNCGRRRIYSAHCDYR